VDPPVEIPDVLERLLYLLRKVRGVGGDDEGLAEVDLTLFAQAHLGVFDPGQFD
jgi:hypothetical protein